MLSDIAFLAIFTLIALVLFWAAPGDRPKLRKTVLTIISMLMVTYVSPGGLVVCTALAILPLAAQWLYRRWKSALTLWLGLCLAVTPMVVLRLTGETSMLVTFGMAFATVKSIGLVMTAYAGRARVGAGDAFLLIFFFPLFTIGPVERLATFADKTFRTPFDWTAILYGAYRILLGLFVIYFVCADILGPTRDIWFGRTTEAIAALSRMEAFGLIYTSFLYTYLNLMGFSSVAIGLSRLFGVTVVENFDRPLLVTNPATFWKRYHISMGNWINQFIYFPLVILMKRDWAPYLATVIAFILFGLWHNFTWNYALWGLGNGTAVAATQFLTNRKILPLASARPSLRPLAAIAGGIFTLSFIAWIQTAANLADMTAVWTLTLRLIGIAV